MSLKDKLQDNDSEDSLISQFETTLTIKSTANDYDDDISMAHSTFYNHSVNYKNEDLDDDPEAVESEMTSFRGKRQSRLIPYEAVKIKPEVKQEIKEKEKEKDRKNRSRSTSRSKSKSPSPPPPSIAQHLNDQLKNYDKVLRSNSLIDKSLSRFTRSFKEFLNSNPQIEKESPKFKRETEKTLVILSPYSAEHAFGRSWVTKSYLSTIFERPQRLLASCIGVSAALTMFPFFYKIVNSTKRGSIFSSHVLKIHGKNWPTKLYELCLESHEKLTNDELEVPEDWNTGDIYLVPKTINAIEGVIGAIETGIDSLYTKNYSLSFILIRPPGHHSHACLPSGFCLINNVQIGIEYAFENYDVSHVAILDIDLHHGDGSQDICWERAGFVGDFGKDENDEIEKSTEETNPRNEYGKRFAMYPKVGYFSLHDIKSYPTELGYATKENIKNASTCIMDHDLNIWNVHLQEWQDEEDFYKLYQTKYVQILNRVNQFLNNAKKQYDLDFKKYVEMKQQDSSLKPPLPFKPLIIISAGFDASEYENPQMQRHGINVPTSFYAKFTNDVVKLSKIHDSKIVSFLEGGYSDGALTTGIFSHLIGLTNTIYEDQDSNLWNNTWGSEQVMKELTKGCKKNWLPYKQPKADVTVWANEVIKLGRAMMPNSILPSNYIYEYKEKDEKDKEDKLLEKLTDEKQVRHTRSYFKKLLEQQNLPKSPR